MTTQPYVELLTGDFSPTAIEQLSSRSLGSPRERINAALISHRLLVLNYVKAEMGKTSILNASVVRSLVEAASEIYLGRLVSLLGPVAAEVYQNVFSDMSADVPSSTIYALSEEHVRRMSRYFNETSRDAVLQGYNTFVNRQLPPRAAADRVLDAYGLTPRQMSGYTSLDTTAKVASGFARSPRAKVVEYISRSFQQRVKVFSEQEQHNLTQQASQSAWSWMSREGVLSSAAQKVWLTAKDEKTCPVCAPMNGKRVLVTERFELNNGVKVWVAGVHPNCRCEVRVVDPMRLRERLEKSAVSKADKWYDDELTRTSDGRFARVKADRQQAAQQRLQEMQRESQTVFKEPTGDVINTEVIEEAPEEETEITLTPQITLSPQITLTPQKEIVVSPLAPAASEEITLSPLSGETKLIGSTESVTLASEKFSLRVSDIAATLKGLPPFTPSPMRTSGKELVRMQQSPTIKLPQPVYAVVPAGAIDHNGQIDLDYDIQFTPSEEQAAMEAMELFDAGMTDIGDVIDMEYGGRVSMKHPVTGETLYGSLDRADIYDVIFAVGFNAETDNFPELTTMEVEWFTAEGSYLYSGEMKAVDIAAQWEISPGEMEMTVIRLQEGHDSHLGMTAMTDSESEYGYEAWSAEGKYNVIASNKHQFSDEIPIVIYDLEPQIEYTEIPGILGDGWNE